MLFFCYDIHKKIKYYYFQNKIDQIHRYCAVGDLNELIQLLDRRKFCLARESRSGLGLTPLHTAVIYKQYDVFGYLMDKFPETLKLIDFQGWTAIDYINYMQDETFIDQLLDAKDNLEVSSRLIQKVLFISI